MSVKARLLVGSVSPGLKWARLHDPCLNSWEWRERIQETENTGLGFLMLANVWPPDFMSLESLLCSSYLGIQTREEAGFRGILFIFDPSFGYGC